MRGAGVLKHRWVVSVPMLQAGSSEVRWTVWRSPNSCEERALEGSSVLSPSMSVPLLSPNWLPAEPVTCLRGRLYPSHVTTRELKAGCLWPRHSRVMKDPR